MAIINIRESLLALDKKTSGKYELTTLYEACKLDEKDKEQLVKYIDTKEPPFMIGQFLTDKCAGCLGEAVEDDATEADKMKFIDDINDGADHSLWALMDDADEKDNKLTEATLEGTDCNNSKQVRTYLYDKIRKFDEFTDDNSRYWDIDLGISEGDDAVLIPDGSKAPDSAKYMFSFVNDEIDIDIFLDRMSDNDTWYVVDKSVVSESVEAAEGLKEDYDVVKMNDKYFPRVDIEDKARYDYVQYKGRDFAYDKKDNVLHFLFKDEEEIEVMGGIENTPFRSLDAAGLSLDSWTDTETRDQYLNDYANDIDEETSYLVQDFIQNELPYYKEQGLVDSLDRKLTEDADSDIEDLIDFVYETITDEYSYSDITFDRDGNKYHITLWTGGGYYSDEDEQEYNFEFDIPTLLKLKDDEKELKEYILDDERYESVNYEERGNEFYRRAEEELEKHFNCTNAFLEPSTQAGRGGTFLFSDDVQFEGNFDYQTGEAYIQNDDFEGFLDLCLDSFTPVSDEDEMEESKSLKEVAKDIDAILDTLGGADKVKARIEETRRAYPGIEDDELIDMLWNDGSREDWKSAVEYLSESVLNEDPQVTLSDDDIWDPKGIDLKGLAKKAVDKEKAEIAEKERQERMAAAREKYKDVFAIIAEKGSITDIMNKLHELLVPESGEAETVAGELVRAMMRILYRDWNDGDKFFAGYGLETCGGSAEFLLDKGFDRVAAIVEDGMRYMDNDDAYTEAINELANDVIQYINNNPDCVGELNEVDSREYDYDFIEENQPMYDYDFMLPYEVQKFLEAGHVSTREIESILEDNLQGNRITFDSIDCSDDYVYIYELTYDGYQQCEEFEMYDDSYWSYYIDEWEDEYGDPDEEDEEEDEDDDIDEAVATLEKPKKDLTQIEGTIASVLNAHKDEIDACGLDTNAIKACVTRILSSGEVKGDPAAKKAIMIINNCRGLNQLLSTLTGYMTGINAITNSKTKARNKAVNESDDMNHKVFDKDGNEIEPPHGRCEHCGKPLIAGEGEDPHCSSCDRRTYDDDYTMLESKHEVGTYAIVGWLSDHPQAYDDALKHFNTDDLDKIKAEDLVDWISEHDQLFADYKNYFKLEEDKEVTEYKFRSSKSVPDSDGFNTDYTWYEAEDGTHVFVFGDNDVYKPEDGYFDHTCDSEAEAQEWFDSYEGFADDLDESKIELTADEMKDKFGTDNPDIINTGRPEEDGTVVLKEEEEDKPYTHQQIFDELKLETKNFTVAEDSGRYGFKEEAEMAVKILEKHYASVELDTVGSWFQVDFKDPLKK